MEFLNKTAIITGGTSGIGYLAGECIAKEGGNVLLISRNAEGLEEKCKQINAFGVGRAAWMVCDVRDYDQVCQARDKAIEEFGSIDILINSAGGYEPRMCNVPQGTDFTDIPIEVFDWGIDVNLKGPFYFAHAVMKQMVKQHSGVIVNLGSVTGEEGSGQGTTSITQCRR